jgi:hypothetical protein
LIGGSGAVTGVWVGTWRGGRVEEEATAETEACAESETWTGSEAEMGARAGSEKTRTGAGGEDGVDSDVGAIRAGSVADVGIDVKAGAEVGAGSVLNSELGSGGSDKVDVSGNLSARADAEVSGAKGRLERVGEVAKV